MVLVAALSAGSELAIPARRHISRRKEVAIQFQEGGLGRDRRVGAMRAQRRSTSTLAPLLPLLLSPGGISRRRLLITVHILSRRRNRKGFLVEKRLRNGNICASAINRIVRSRRRVLAAELSVHVAHRHRMQRQDELRNARKISWTDIGVVLDAHFAGLQINQARAVLALRLPSAQPDAEVATAELVIILR